jgi:hypothetical protein
VVGGIAVLMLLVGCMAGAVFFLNRWLAAPAAPPPPAIPTVPGAAATATAVAVVTADPTSPPAITATPVPGVPPGAVIAVRRDTPPQVDGDLGDWENRDLATSSFRVYAVNGWDGTDDLTAAWRLAWDDAHLYVAVDVIDDTHVQTQSGELMYRGDSVEIQVDTAPQRNATAVSPDTYQLLLSPGNFGDLSPSAFRFRGTGEGRIVGAPGHGIAVAAQQAGDGYTLEARIPWADLGVTPAPGMVLGIALNANDNDSSGAAVQEVMKSHVAGRTLTNPSSWGSLYLRGGAGE